MTKDNYTVTAVTRNIHQNGIVRKTFENGGVINIVDSNIFNEEKIRVIFTQITLLKYLLNITENLKTQIFSLGQ